MLVVQMAVVPVVSERGKVPPALLDRSVCLEIRHEQVEKLLNVWRQSSQTTLDLPFDPDLVLHYGDNITALPLVTQVISSEANGANQRRGLPRTLDLLVRRFSVTGSTVSRNGNRLKSVSLV